MINLKRILAASTILLCGYANAYTTTGCFWHDVKWSGSSKTLYAYTGSFPSGSSERSALNEAVTRLNQNTSNFSFNVVYTSTPPSLSNGRSEIWLANISPPGIAYSWWNIWCNKTESDVILDTSVNWSTSINKTTQSNYGGSGRPFQTTMLHELGHALGLGHEADEYNIMGSDPTHRQTNGSWARAYFGEDANDGAMALYGSDGRRDVGVSHWRRTGANGEYSSHGRTRMFDSATGSELTKDIVNGEPVYRVFRGQQVRVELTYENNGSNNIYEDVGFYLSTNSTISTGDQLIGNTTLSMSPDNVVTTWHTVTIPSSLQCNTNYWVGAVIDRNNSLSEYAEWNNASYISVKTNFDWGCLTVPLLTLN